MKAEAKDGDSDTPSPPSRETSVMTILEKNIAHREIHVIDEEGAAARERDIRAAEVMQATVDHHMITLRQANAQLVITSIARQQLAEQIQTAKDELDYLAHHDVLTDLPNRILLKDRLTQAIELAHRQGRQLAVMYMDLDRFKHINDSLGHAIGDQLLQSVAQRLLASVRQSDTISRQGGDEFILLFPAIERAEDAALSAQKMLDTFSLPHHIEGHDLHVSGCIGISIYPNNGQDAEALIKSADTAMYAAKESGSNNFKFFENSMNVRAILRQSIETSLRQALLRQEFVLHYQPKIDLTCGAIVGVEALIRWRQAQAWRQAGLPPITIAVNNSALGFQAKDFLENVRATLQDTGLEPRYLELELTESVLMRDVESTDRVLRAFSDLGVKLAVDDFGTGYSSLSYLRQFPIDTLKIDRSFVEQMTNNLDDAAIVSAVISMGKNLKQPVIAEGVETVEQYAFLLAERCDEGQGFYFGWPVAADALATLLLTGVSPALLH